MRIDVNKALVVLAGVTAASCSGYSKVLKSNDSNLKYQTAIEYTDKGKYNKALTLFQDVAHAYFLEMVSFAPNHRSCFTSSA